MSEQQIKNYSLQFLPQNQENQGKILENLSYPQQQKNQQKNQFLDDVFYYEKCPHCERKFFQGKLKYHLKLCKSENPMVKSPLKKNKRNFIASALAFQQTKKQNNSEDINCIQTTNNTNSKQSRIYQKCQKCKIKFPSFLIQKHKIKCQSESVKQYPQFQSKAQTKMNFKISQELALPRIQNSAKQRKFSQKRKGLSDVSQLGQYTVRIRQDLSCFTKAKQVQKVECNYCGRKFSKQASLRHIPICCNLKCQQQKSMVLKIKPQTRRNSKSDLSKQGLRAKKAKQTQIEGQLNKIQQQIISKSHNNKRTFF